MFASVLPKVSSDRGMFWNILVDFLIHCPLVARFLTLDFQVVVVLNVVGEVLSPVFL